MKKYIIGGIISLITLVCGQVNTEAMRSADSGDGFKNRFNFDIRYEKANSEVVDLSGEYRLDYFKENNFHSFMIINLENGYKIEDNLNSVITDKGFIHLRTTKNILKNYQIEAFMQYEFNEFLLLNDRYLIGSGLRISLQKNEHTNTYVGMGCMYENETYNIVDIEPDMSLFRSTNYIKNNFSLSSNIKFNNTAYFQIASNDFNDYRILYDGGLEFHANDVFAFTFSLNYRYDNDPHGDLGSSYIQISNGMSFNF